MLYYLQQVLYLWKHLSNFWQNLLLLLPIAPELSHWHSYFAKSPDNSYRFYVYGSISANFGLYWDLTVLNWDLASVQTFFGRFVVLHMGAPSPVSLDVLCVHSPPHSLLIYTLSPDSPLCPTLCYYINHSFLPLIHPCTRRSTRPRIYVIQQINQRKSEHLLCKISV